MSSQPFLGIDFGTCNSSMAWFNPRTGQAEVLLNAEGEDKTPSVVRFGPRQVLVGKQAEECLEIPEDRKRVIAAAKRELAKRRVWMIDARPITPVDAAVAVLRKLRCDAEALHFYKPVSRAVITHPAVFDEIEKDKLRQAAAGAGFQEIELLAEPVAAALAYAAAGVEVGRHVLVYDLGGGTFDLALLVRDEDDGVFRLGLEPRGARLGGEDFDRAVYDFFDEQIQNQYGKPLCADGRDLSFLRQCRKYKENLSLNESPVPMSWWWPGMGRLKLQMKRTVFEGLIVPHIERTVQLTRSIWEDAVLAGQRTDTVILIGGSTRVPLIQRRLRESLAVEPRRWQKQDLAVTLGAAHFAQMLWGNDQGLTANKSYAPSGSLGKQAVPQGHSPFEQRKPAEPCPASDNSAKHSDARNEDLIKVPVPTPDAVGKDERWAIYLLNDGVKQRGPFTIADLADEEIHSFTLVWKPGLPGWTYAGEIAELEPLVILQSCRAAEQPSPKAAQDKARVEATRCPGCRRLIERGLSFCPQCQHDPIRQGPDKEVTVAASVLMLLGMLLLVLGVIVLETSSHSSSSWDPNDGHDGGYRYESQTNGTQHEFGKGLCFLGCLAELLGFVFFLVWLYQAWSVVPSQHDNPSPSMAVGLLLIPVFNFYWMSRVIPVLSSALQRPLRELDPSGSSDTGYSVGAIACVLIWFPFTAPIALVLVMVWMNKVNHAITRIIKLQQRQSC